MGRTIQVLQVWLLHAGLARLEMTHLGFGASADLSCLR